MKSKKNNVYIEYGVLFLLVGFFVFFWRLVLGRTMIWSSDGYTQHYPALISLHRALDVLVHEHRFEFWSWSLGLGDDVIGTMYGVYCDPFSYIAAAFPAAKLDVGYGIANYLRLFAAGLSMLYFLRRRAFSDAKCLIGGISYAFCAWGILCIRHSFFLLPMVLFPLLVEGVIRWDRERKFGLLLTAVFLSLATCLYFAWMSALMMLIYVIVSSLIEDRRDVKVFLQRFLSLSVIIIVAALIAAPIMLPVLEGILQASKDTGVEKRILFQLPVYLRFPVSFVTGREAFGNYSVVFGNVFTASVLPMIWIKAREKKSLPQIMFGISLILLLIPFADRVFNGMSYPVGRWCYCLSFFQVWAAVDSFEPARFSDRAYCRRYIRLLTAFICILGLSVYITSLFFASELSADQLSQLIFVVAGIIVFAAGFLHEKSEKSILALVCLSIMLMNFAYPNPLNSGILTGYTRRGEAFRKYCEYPLAKMQQVEDSDFYRVISPDAEVKNESLFMDQHTTRAFWSVLSSSWDSFKRSIGDTTGEGFRVTRVTDDYRVRENFLLGAKYIAGRCSINGDVVPVLGAAYDTIWDDGYYYIAKNAYPAGLGYVYDRVISEEELEEYSQVEREEIMMQAAVVDSYEGAVSRVGKEELQLDWEHIPFEARGEGEIQLENGTFTIGNAGGSLILKPTRTEDCETYFVLKNFHRVEEGAKERERRLLDELASNIELQNALKPEEQQDLLGPDPLSGFAIRMQKFTYTPAADFHIGVSDGRVARSINSAEGASNQSAEPVTDYIASLGYHKESEREIRVNFHTPGSYSFDEIQLLQLPQESFRVQAAELSANRLEIQTVQGDYVRGITKGRAGLLYMSIPYNSGWQIWVDGQLCEKVYRTNMGFIGVDVGDGTHVIEMKYLPLGMKTAAVVSGITLLGVLVVSGGLFVRKRRKVCRE